MELELETATRETPAPMPEVDLTNVDVKLGEVVDWDNMICDSCQ
jgi:hypothetical protein